MFDKKRMRRRGKRWLSIVTALMITMNSLALGDLQVLAEEAQQTEEQNVDTTETGSEDLNEGEEPSDTDPEADAADETDKNDAEGKPAADETDKDDAEGNPAADETDKNDAEGKPAADETDKDDAEGNPAADETDKDDAEEKPAAGETNKDDAEGKPAADETDKDDAEEKPAADGLNAAKSEDPDVIVDVVEASEIDLLQETGAVAKEGKISLDKKEDVSDNHYPFSDETVAEFTYEADIDLKGEESISAALTFGIKNKDNIAANWMGANINFNDGGARIFRVGSDAGDIGSEPFNGLLDRSKTIHAKLQVTQDGTVAYEVYNTETPDKKVTVTGHIPNYDGGYLGLLTFESAADFSNVKFEKSVEIVENGLTDFRNVHDDAKMQINNIAKSVRLAKRAGDHLAMYEGLHAPSNAFVMEADVCFADTNSDAKNSAGLVFGASEIDRVPGTWYGANVDTQHKGTSNLFRVFAGESDYVIPDGADVSSIDLDKPLHLKLEMAATGKFTYTFGNTDAEGTCSITGTIPSWEGGYVGILTFDAEAVFSNIEFEDKTDFSIDLTETYKTNLEGLRYSNGTWEVTENGLYSDATGKGDCFAFTESEGANFVYSTEVDFDSNEGAAALIFRSNNDLGNKECYGANIDVSSHMCKFWRWQKNKDLQLIDTKPVKPTKDEKYTLKVVAYDTWMLYYVNDELIASTGDYTLQVGDLGQNTVIKDGCFGLLNFNSKVTFQNTYFKEFDNTYNPLLEDLEIKAASGTVEERPQFTSTEPITIQYVRNNVSAVKVNVKKSSDKADVTVTDADGKEYSAGADIPVKVGINWITVTSKVTDKVTDEEDMEAALTYRINVHRLKPDEIYYNEAYRGQYHYSVKEGWANDPNGMVYYKGKYHLFYQFYDDNKWGPMHWAHATSTDLLHWEEQPIALYPDANGAMFSGCAVVDEGNTSGLFKNGEGGLVALITADGNGQRIKLAYSEDEGATWKKVDDIAADWTDDPLRADAFRDPKVFRWEGKWFMVVAGGPLRIYSSDNLKSWKCESTYGNLHTECPDLYPALTEDGHVKWVLSRGGRFYKIGDFKVVDGSWKFVPDEAYADEPSNGVMNFGPDSYAAMTYYRQNFGTAADPKIPEIVEINWMNTWDDYCNLVAEKNGEDFNGTFNLHLKIGVKKEGDKYVLTQTPIKEYEKLRIEDQKLEYTDVSLGEDNTLLENFAGDTYEIVSHFVPQGGTKKVGFRLRTGSDQETLVVYNLETEEIYIDRSRSGIIVSGRFADVCKQKISKNADGSVDLHVYVDKASVEVFTKGNTAAGAVQIFPSTLSLGASVLVEGAPATADIVIYPLESIWKDKAEVTEPLMVGSSMASSHGIYVGDSLKLDAYVLPVTVSQEIVWSVTSDEDVVSVSQDGTVTAKKEGTAVVTAASKIASSLKKEFTIEVKVNNFATNIPKYVNQNGNWLIDGDELTDSNKDANDFYMSQAAIEGDYTMEMDISFTKGMINLFAASSSVNPFADGGAYAVQFDNDLTNVRLFRFGGDTIATGSLPAPINDGQYHHVKIVRTGKKLQVFVDSDTKLRAQTREAAKAVLEYEFTDTDAYFDNGLIGVGLYNGELKVKNLFVYVDTSVLEEAVQQIEVEDIKEADYTPESYRAYKEALEQAQKLIAEGTSSKAEVDAALERLKAAKAALVKKGVQPGGDGSDENEQKPGGDGSDENEQKPGGDGSDENEQKPGGDGLDENEQKPGGDGSGGNEQKPGGDNTGENGQKPGGDSSNNSGSESSGGSHGSRNDGSASGMATLASQVASAQNSDTSDHNNTDLYMILLMLSMAGTCGIYFNRKRKMNK